MPNYLGIYKYQGNWTPAISSSINTLWKRISNLDGTNSDNSVNLTTLTASARVSDVRGVYVLAEFICGNQECEFSFGENSNNCPNDCPIASVRSWCRWSRRRWELAQDAGGAGAGAGPGINITLPNITAPNITLPNITVPNITRAPVEFKATVIDLTVIPMEEKLFSVDVTNHLAQDC